MALAPNGRGVPSLLARVRELLSHCDVKRVATLTALALMAACSANPLSSDDGGAAGTGGASAAAAGSSGAGRDGGGPAGGSGGAGGTAMTGTAGLNGGAGTVGSGGGGGGGSGGAGGTATTGTAGFDGGGGTVGSGGAGGGTPLGAAGAVGSGGAGGGSTAAGGSGGAVNAGGAGAEASQAVDGAGPSVSAARGAEAPQPADGAGRDLLVALEVTAQARRPGPSAAAVALEVTAQVAAPARRRQRWLWRLRRKLAPPPVGGSFMGGGGAGGGGPPPGLPGDVAARCDAPGGNPITFQDRADAQSHFVGRWILCRRPGLGWATQQTDQGGIEIRADMSWQLLHWVSGTLTTAQGTDASGAWRFQPPMMLDTAPSTAPSCSSGSTTASSVTVLDSPRKMLWDNGSVDVPDDAPP